MDIEQEKNNLKEVREICNACGIQLLGQMKMLQQSSLDFFSRFFFSQLDLRIKIFSSILFQKTDLFCSHASSH